MVVVYILGTFHSHSLLIYFYGDSSMFPLDQIQVRQGGLAI